MNGPDEMDQLEKDLVQAMKHVDAPEGFAARVLERAADEARAAETKRGPAKVFTMMRRPQVRVWLGGAIAATLAIGVFAGQQIHERRERQQVAEQQFETALRIESVALERTRQQLERKGISLGQ